MTAPRTLQRRERFLLDIAKIIFGGGYDDNIGIARSIAKDERLWKSPARKRRATRKTKP